MTLKRHKIKLYICMAMTVVIAGCMVGPDYVRPRTAADDGTGFINAPPGWTDANDVCGEGPWWRCFGDKVTADLVLLALERNRDLKAAAAKVLEAEALLAQSHGVRLPNISYAANRQRGKVSRAVFGGAGSFYSTIYNQNFNVSYIVDFFGKLRRAEKAAVADLLASKAERQSLRHAIISQVVRTRIQIATQQRLLDVARANIISREQTLQIVERRYNSGLVGPLDVYMAKENLEAARALEPQILESVKLARHSLDVLIGQRPGALAQLPDSLGDMSEPEPVPLSLPAALLDRRPDVRAAEMRLRAATERVGVSIAALFPDLTFSGSWGYQVGKFSMLTDPEGEVYSAIIGLAAPVFKGGQLKAQVDAAKARAAQAAENYAGVVLVALREVEDALVRQQTLKDRLGHLTERLKQASQAEALARQRYMRGVEQLLVVLDTERRRILAENELILTTGNLWNGRVELFLALGGSWDVGMDDEQPVDLGIADAETN
ncbi:MAG TPA: efflux transporter outer membrane subunit [Planctomycetes bacterium]|nr:efflux transporter outer membrane subunit [Planctomycetota bacterium]